MADLRCPKCEYWRHTSYNNKRSMKVCHYYLDTGVRRKRNEQDTVCYSFKKKEAKDDRI